MSRRNVGSSPLVLIMDMGAWIALEASGGFY
jgi:hypothetical protein